MNSLVSLESFELQESENLQNVQRMKYRKDSVVSDYDEDVPYIQIAVTKSVSETDCESISDNTSFHNYEIKKVSA